MAPMDEGDQILDPSKHGRRASADQGPVRSPAKKQHWDPRLDPGNQPPNVAGTKKEADKRPSGDSSSGNSYENPWTAGK
eukprot:11481784-Heterocapsa_arctica.AAC.1